MLKPFAFPPDAGGAGAARGLPPDERVPQGSGSEMAHHGLLGWS
jgi:hypothetical protein